MKLPIHVIQLLKDRSGSALRLPSDCEFLSLDIESKTGVHIGATTLKRLLGFASDERTPHISTLDVIAHYLGFDHWEQLTAVADQGNSGFGTIDGELRSADVPVGAHVSIRYLPDRQVVFRHEGDGMFLVVESHNSKLICGDICRIQSFVKGHPLLVTDVLRSQESLGQFTAGRISGLLSIEAVYP